MSRHHLYIIIISLAFIGAAVVFLAFPRTSYSELEKRELKQFPAVTWQAVSNNTLTHDISSWFSDTEPFRDQIMSLSMAIRQAMRINLSGEENIVFHAPPQDKNAKPVTMVEGLEDEESETELPEGVATITNTGILIVGEVPTVRAMMSYGGGAQGGEKYAEAINKYAEALSDSAVRIYSMVVPNSAEFYLPKSAKKRSNPQLPTIHHIRDLLNDKVTYVNAHKALETHRNEDIYLRTDHHWAPLGAFYAAQEFARVAKVPFKGLNDYDRKEVKDFVGTMYGYAKDAAVKNSPETFVYYVPRLPINTTYTDYTLNNKYQVTGEKKPIKGEYFQHFRDGNTNAYCTFMGSDKRLTVVETGSNQPRNLLVIKDSYGNAVPGYLFYSFGNVHVIDFRYFNKNIKKYVKDNHITDVLIINNIYNAYSPSTAKKLERYLNL